MYLSNVGVFCVGLVFVMNRILLVCFLLVMYFGGLMCFLSWIFIKCGFLDLEVKDMI